MPKKLFGILVQTVDLIWTILKLTPKSMLLSLTILYKIGASTEIRQNWIWRDGGSKKLKKKSDIVNGSSLTQSPENLHIYEQKQ